MIRINFSDGVLHSRAAFDEKLRELLDAEQKRHGISCGNLSISGRFTELIRNLHQEMPYATSVEIEAYEREGNMDRISAIIWVEREGQKAIVIGNGGETLKLIGSNARRDIERATGRKVFLKLWCKVKENWSDDPKALAKFGY